MGSMFAGNWIKETLGFSSWEIVIMVMSLTVFVNFLLFRFGGRKRRDSISFYSSLVFVGAGQFYKRKWIRGLIITGLFVGCSFYKLIQGGESIADHIIVIMTLVSPIEAFVTGSKSSSSTYSSSGSGKSSYGLADQMEDEQLGRFQDDLNNMSDDYNHHY